MLTIKKNLDQLRDALSQGKPVVFNPQGGWSVEGKGMGFFRDVFHLNEARLNTVADALIKALNELESDPVELEMSETHKEKFHNYVEIARSTIAQEEHSSLPASFTLKVALARRLIALQYRLERRNGGLNPVETQPDILKELLHLAFDWKKQQVLIEEKTISATELEKLREAARYPEFTELMLGLIELRNEFFTWIIRDGNTVAPFIQYPSTTKKLIDVGLNGRIGRMGGRDLQIFTQKGYKYLGLKMNGKLTNILDEKQIVEFAGSYKLSVKEIFEIFRNKNTKSGNLEFMADGIVNWNPHKLARWDALNKVYHPIDMTQAKWWEQMPLLEELTFEQAQNRYGLGLDGTNWIAAAAATRGYANLDVDQTHAFLEVVIPVGNGNYRTYYFGKFAEVFHASFMENFFTFCHTVPAVISMPDENIFYSHRQFKRESFILDHQEGLRLMDLIKKDILNVRKKNFAYQITSENCAKWVHERIEAVVGTHRMPNLFRMPILHTTPAGPVGILFDTIKKLPSSMHFFVVTRMHLIGGAFIGMEVEENGRRFKRTLHTHEFFDTAEVYLPALLHERNKLRLPQEAPLHPSDLPNFAHAPFLIRR